MSGGEKRAWADVVGAHRPSRLRTTDDGALDTWSGRAALLGLLGAGVALRVYALGRLPGINGDEAWCGVLAQRIGHANPDGWLTSSGNLPAPFHLGLLAVFSRVAPPSFVLLRVPAVIASLAQLFLTFWVARRHFGRTAGIVALLLTAALPIEIAYARLGWDPSYEGVVAVGALHFALMRRAGPAAALFALGAWIHPTAVFIGPFLVFAAVGARSDGLRITGRARLAAGLAAAVLICALAVARPAALLRVIDPRQWARFALAFARLLDGDTILTYVTGAGWGGARAIIDVSTLALLAAAVALGGRRLRRARAELALVVGWCATLAAFHVFAGPEALLPHVERYGLCLLVPTIFAVAVLVSAAGQGLRPAIPVAALAAALLVAFWRFYLVALETTGSTSHATFWTGAVEPKAEAFRRIEADARGGSAFVVAESWWLYWPLAYLAHGTRVDVADAAPLVGAPPPPGAYLVGFPGGRVEAWAARSSGARLAWEVAGAGGRIVVRVWKTQGP